MRPVRPSVPLHRRGKEACALVEPVEPAEVLCIGVEYYPVGPRHLDADAVVGVALGGVEVEDENDTGPLEHDDLVALVLERDVGLWGVEPAVFGLSEVHGPVEIVQEMVSQKVIVGEIELPPSVPEGVLVAFAGEVEPLGVAELVAFEVEVALAAEPLREEANHLVKRHSAVNDGSQWCQYGHVGVHLRIAEMHH